MKVSLRSALVFTLVLLTACKDITHVQTGYIADRDECRGKSEENAGVYSQPDAYPMSDKDHSAALLQLFCECMKDKDWKTSGCPKPAPVVAAAPAPAPAIVVVQSPTAQPAILPAAVPVATPVAVHHKRHRKRKNVCMPPATCPAPDYGINTGSGTAGSTSAAPAPQPDQQLNSILQRQ